MKRLILTSFTATSLLLSSSPYNKSWNTSGTHIHRKNKSDIKIETDGSSGYFLGIKFPIGVDSDSCKMLTAD